MAGQKTDERDVYLGQRIAEQRKKASLTQRRVAQSFGMSAAQLQKYEKGTNRISAVHLDVFSRLTNVPIEYFFRGIPRVEEAEPRGMAEPPQDGLVQDGLQGLAEILGRHVAENFSADARRDFAAAVHVLDRTLNG